MHGVTCFVRPCRRIDHHLRPQPEPLRAFDPGWGLGLRNRSRFRRGARRQLRIGPRPAKPGRRGGSMASFEFLHPDQVTGALVDVVQWLTGPPVANTIPDLGVTKDDKKPCSCSPSRRGCPRFRLLRAGGSPVGPARTSPSSRRTCRSSRSSPSVIATRTVKPTACGPAASVRLRPPGVRAGRLHGDM